jgi:hypothetical protein
MTFSLVFSRTSESPSGRWALWCANANGDPRKVSSSGRAQTIVWWRGEILIFLRSDLATWPSNPPHWALLTRKSGAARLKPHVAAYWEALKEDTRERVPLAWAGAERRACTLGRAREYRRPSRGSGRRLSRGARSVDWAAAQMNLRNALKGLGDHEHGTVRLEGAIARCSRKTSRARTSRVDSAEKTSRHTCGSRSRRRSLLLSKRQELRGEFTRQAPVKRNVVRCPQTIEDGENINRGSAGDSPRLSARSISERA